MEDFVRSILSSPEFTAFALATFGAAVTGILAWAAAMFRKHILRLLDERELALARQLAVIAVQYVEQKYQEADGPEKLDAAMDALNDMLEGYGIKVRAEQLLAIVEAAVYAETTHTALPEG